MDDKASSPSLEDFLACIVDAELCNAQVVGAIYQNDARCLLEELDVLVQRMAVT